MKDLGISESCLCNWMAKNDVDAGRKEGLTSDQRAELVRLRRENRVHAMEIEILERASAYFARENVIPKWASGWSTSSPPRIVRGGVLPGPGPLALWLVRMVRSTTLAPTGRRRRLTATIEQVHRASRGCYGAPRVHAELCLGLGLACSRKRVARLMRAAGLAGIGGRRKGRGRRPDVAVHEDLVQRRFVADGPNRLWCTDITDSEPNYTPQL